MSDDVGTEITAQQVYDFVWKDKVEKDGQIDMEAVKELLFQYGALIAATSEVYDYITDGAVVDPRTPTDIVAYYADKFTADSVDDGIRQILDDILNIIGSDVEDLPKVVEEYVSSIYIEKAS